MSINDATPAEWDALPAGQKKWVKVDVINKPEHYNKGGIEAIEAIEASMPSQEYKGYLKGNCLKYLWRYEDKNGVEDLRKARVYLDWLIKSMVE